MIDSLGTMLMSTTTTATSERRPAHRAARSRLLGILAVFGFVLGATAHAENVLEDLAYTALPGGKVEVTLKFAEPVAEPQVFSTETPPSVALDFADTRNGLSKRRVDIGAGATQGVSVIEAAGRTRVVVDLFRIAGYDSWEPFVTHDTRFDRPAEVDLLMGDATKAREKLGWEPTVDFEELVRRMYESDLKAEQTQLEQGRR